MNFTLQNFSPKAAWPALVCPHILQSYPTNFNFCIKIDWFYEIKSQQIWNCILQMNIILRKQNAVLVIFIVCKKSWKIFFEQCTFPALKHYSSLNYKCVPSSPSIWLYVVSVKSTVKILSNFVAFLENTNFTSLHFTSFK